MDKNKTETMLIKIFKKNGSIEEYTFESEITEISAYDVREDILSALNGDKTYCIVGNKIMKRTEIEEVIVESVKSTNPKLLTYSPPNNKTLKKGRPKKLKQEELPLSD